LIFQCNKKPRAINWLVLDAVKSAYHQKVREVWHVGDQIQVHGGKFIGWQAHLVEIDSSSQSALVSVLDFETSKLIDVQIVLVNLEWYFTIGDVVQVVIGLGKGQKGSITSIEDEVAIIVEFSFEAGQFFVKISIFSLSFSLSKHLTGSSQELCPGFSVSANAHIAGTCTQNSYGASYTDNGS
jgi:ribosomal protein L24